MLASIRGTVIEKNDFNAVVDCNGFGLELLLSRRAADLCRVGGTVELRTHLQVSDAGIALYGFADDLERRTFRLILLTKGVGCKTAIAVLQVLTPAEIVSAVQQNDTALLTSVPGIGKKTAERICFELTDRIRKDGFEQIVGELTPGKEGAAPIGVLDALEALGFDRPTALRAWKKVAAGGGEELNESDAIMHCLRVLQPRR